MARKNAKTQYLALLALFLLIFDREAKPEIYIAATESEQAGECYEASRDMVRSNPDLDEILVITDYRKTIYYPENGGILKALSSKGKTKHGSNPSTIIFDELHAWGPEHQDLYTALTTGRGARRQPLRISITTAGSDEESICFEEYSYAQKVLSGVIQDPTYLADIYELPRDADWTDESLWHLAHPGLDHIVSRQFLREERDEALNSPRKQNDFRRLYGNQWTQTSEVWIPLHTWDKNAAAVPLDVLASVPAYGGLDLAAVNDLTAFVLWWELGGEFYVKPWFWIPEKDSAGADIQERGRKCGVDYPAWVKSGHMEVTPGNVTDHVFVTDRIQQLAEQFDFRQIAYDRYGARDVATRLLEAGIEVVPWGQGYLDMSPPCKRLESIVISEKLHHGAHPVLRWNVDCASVTSDPAGNIKPVKPERRRSTKRIDGVVATAMACGIWMREESPYADVGVSSVNAA